MEVGVKPIGAALGAVHIIMLHITHWYNDFNYMAKCFYYSKYWRPHIEESIYLVLYV